MIFKKGEVANPLGQLPVGRDLIEARKLTRLEFERLVNKYLFMGVKEIEKILDNPYSDIPLIDALILSGLRMAYRDGDTKRLDFFLDRTIGRVVMKHHVVTEVDDSSRVAPVQLSDEEKLAMVEAYKSRLLSQRKEVIDVSSSSGESEPQVPAHDEK